MLSPKFIFPLGVILGSLSTSGAAELKLTAPLDYQVVQRRQAALGTVPVAGEIAGTDAGDITVQTRLASDKITEWQPLPVRRDGPRFTADLEAPAGGWYRLEVRVVAGGMTIAEQSVAHVGVGEVFVVAGQSNSANYGEEKQNTRTGRVAAFDGQHWQLANDPEPGAGGQRGSFMPPLGDALVERFHVPVGFIACGIGGTSVREWLPEGATFPDPPTIESRVRRLPGGGWASRGDAFARLVERMKQVGPGGFRAVLWHQGESDANQKDPTRTLPGKLYREDLETIIRESGRRVGWEAPWFVAQATYHIPGDESAPDIRAAQASLWRDGIALEGPDTDAMKGEYRQDHGQGVHFNGAGLREHAARWMEKIAPWLKEQLRLHP